jgi:hypothetical protein
VGYIRVGNRRVVPWYALVLTLAQTLAYVSFTSIMVVAQGQRTIYDTYVSLDIPLVVSVLFSIPYVVRCTLSSAIETAAVA